MKINKNLIAPAILLILPAALACVVPADWFGVAIAGTVIFFLPRARDIKARIIPCIVMLPAVYLSGSWNRSCKNFQS